MYGGVSPDDLPRPHLFASKNIREPKDRRLKSLFPLWPAMALCSCEISGCMPACCCCNPGNEALNRASQGNRPLAAGGRETYARTCTDASFSAPLELSIQHSWNLAAMWEQA